MMQEDNFKGFQDTYRLLRKEHMKFPERDPNVRMLMSSLGVDSPMFEYTEQIYGRPTPKPPKTKTKEEIELEKFKKEVD